jgi:tetratricopeptide (TPR) repeat protein
VPASGPALPTDGAQDAGDPSDSAVFEDESFSDLSSFELADGAENIQRDETPGIFDTLVDGYDDDPADRSFDDFLIDLGLPVDEDAPTDPDRTGTMQRPGDQEVAEQWGLESDAGEASPEDATAAISLDDLQAAPDGLRESGLRENKSRGRQHTPRLQDMPQFESNSAPNDEFPDEKTEVLGPGRSSPSRPKPSRPKPPRPEPSSPKPSAPKTPAASQPSSGQPSSGQPSSNQLQPRKQQGPNRPQPPSSDDPVRQTGKRPLPPSVQKGRRDRRRVTGQSRSIRRPDTDRQGPSAGDEPRAATQPGSEGGALSLPYKYIVPATAAAVLIVVAGVAFGASSSAASAVNDHLAAFRSVSAADTYQGYLAGEQSLEAALGAESFLGASADDLLSQVGLMDDASAARGEALVELARLKAMVEYRYERVDTHESRTVLERAEAAVSGDPRLDVARSYRLMAQGRTAEATELLEVTRKNFPDFTDAATALLHAHLDDNALQSASMTATVLNGLENPSIHQHYVLGLLESRQGKAAADARLRHLIETLSPEHLSARIARSYTLRQSGEANADEQATALLEEVLGPLRANASPLQRANAHIALGELYVDGDSRARAEEQFRKAIKVLPARSSVYGPLIELYRDDGRLDKSLELIEDAVSQSAISPDLVLRKAEILRLTGQAEAALRALDEDTLDEEALDSARAKWLEGMALLDLGRLDDATSAFEAASNKSDEFAPARAYLLMSKELASRDERNAFSSDLEKMLEKFSTDPHVLRAGAIAAMHVANFSDSRTGRQELLERAESLLEQAMDRGGSQAVLLFDLCRQQMLSSRGQDASISCRKAKRLNDTYLPGLLTMADLERRRGNRDEAIKLLAELGERFADKPRINQMKADAHLERFEIEAAEKEINRWAGTPAAKSSLHHFVEGRLAFAEDRYTSALGYFQRAHKNMPNDARFGLYYAHTLTRLGEHERAEELVKRYLTDLELEPVAWLIFGEIRRRQGRFSDARENLGLALQKLGDAIAPPWRTSQAYTQLAQTWADRYGFDHRFVGRYLYRGAQRGDENYPPLNAARGRYHLERRRPDQDKAAEAFEKVVAVAPFNCPALNSLRAIYQNQDADDALERVEKMRQEHCKD